MAEEISKPLTAANKVTMVSSGGGEIGAAKLTGEVLDIMTKLPETIEKLTGISISQVKTAFQIIQIQKLFSCKWSWRYFVHHVICAYFCKYNWQNFSPLGGPNRLNPTWHHCMHALWIFPFIILSLFSVSFLNSLLFL